MPAIGPGPAAWRSRGTAPGPGRIAAVDAVRGTALVGMVAYHLAWDLHAVGLTVVDPGRSLPWRLLGGGVAGLFLALTGFGLILARGRGATRTDAARRLLSIAAAALLVTVVTRVATPDSAITFGILQCIVVTNLIALGLEPLPSSALVLLAGLAVLAPALVRLPGAWGWTGLAATDPTTLDFRPVLPWLAPVLLGMALARTRAPARLADWRIGLRATAVLRWAGRHSLAIYLLHQPVLIAPVLIVAHGTPSQTDLARGLRSTAQATDFLRSCAASCRQAGGDPPLCTATCHCVLTGAIARAEAVRESGVARWLRPAAPLRDAVAACRPTGGG